jgi:hypothetical protein
MTFKLFYHVFHNIQEIYNILEVQIFNYYLELQIFIYYRTLSRPSFRSVKNKYLYILDNIK